MACKSTAWQGTASARVRRIGDTFLNWLGYQFVTRLPDRIAWRTSCNPDHWLGNWALPRAGDWAYRDH
jgi:hypothetical protein